MVGLLDSMKMNSFFDWYFEICWFLSFSNVRFVIVEWLVVFCQRAARMSSVVKAIEGPLRHYAPPFTGRCRDPHVSLFTKCVQLFDEQHNSVIQFGTYLEGSATLFYCAQQMISGCVFNLVAFGTSRHGRVWQLSRLPRPKLTGTWMSFMFDYLLCISFSLLTFV